MATIEFVDSMLQAHIDKDKTPPLDLSLTSNILNQLDDDAELGEPLDLSDEDDYSDHSDQTPLTPPPTQLTDSVDLVQQPHPVISLQSDVAEIQSSPKAGLEESIVLQNSEDLRKKERSFDAYGPQLSPWLNATKAKQDGLKVIEESSRMGEQGGNGDSKTKEKSQKKRKSVKTEEKEPQNSSKLTETSSEPTSSKKKIRPPTETTLQLEAQVRSWAKILKTNPSFLETLPRRSALTVRQYIDSEQEFIKVLGEDYQVPNDRETNHKRRGRMRSDARWKEHLRTKKSNK